MSKHTPGPWRVLNDGITVVPPKPRGQTVICRMREVYGNRAERQKNAALVAASPDLLEALREVIRLVPRPYATVDVLDKGPDPEHPAVIAARATIAKAEGWP